MELEMSQIIYVHSFRSDTGRSIVAANLATSLALEGLRVGIVDTDLRAPGMHLMFGLDEAEI